MFFLWKNAIVIVVLLGLTSVPGFALSRANWERGVMSRLVLAAIVISCLVLSILPFPACQLLAGGLLLACFERRTPMVATYLFFLVWTPASASYLVAFGSYFVPLRPVIAFTVAVVIGYAANPGMRLSRKFTSADVYSIAFLLIYCVCISMRDTGTGFLRNFITYTLPYLATFQILSRTRIERPEMVLRLFLFAAAATALILIFETVKYWPLYSGIGEVKRYTALADSPSMMLIRGGFFRAYGPFSHPLAASSVLGLGGVAFFGLVYMRGPSLPVLAIGALTLLGLFATFSRTGIVAFAAGLMVLQLLRGRYLAVFSAAAIGFIFIFGVPLLSGQDAQSNGAYRLALVMGVPRIMGTRLIFGYREAVDNGLLDAFVQGQGIVDLVNVYLSIAVRGGIVSLIPYMLFLGSTFTQYRKLRKAGPDREQLILAQTSVGLQAGFSTAGLFMGAWGTPMMISFLSVAIIVALRAEVEKAGARRPKPPSPIASPPQPRFVGERLPVLS